MVVPYVHHIEGVIVTEMFRRVGSLIERLNGRGLQMSSHKKSKEMKWTNNNCQFNKLRRKKELRGQDVCIFCAPYDGENFKRSYYKRHGLRTWKRYRRYQWK